jgi:ABC-2 type transport system ATP-binding protein
MTRPRPAGRLGTVTGLLELDGLTRSYGPVLALDGLRFEVPAGQMWGFLGPNGAGKTTAMRAIFGLTDLDAGAVRWNGAPAGPQRRRFGYMPEQRGLYPSMLVGEQLEYLGTLHGLTAPAAALAARDWLERLGLAGRAGDKVEVLSHGNQQRVQLAAALVHDPELIVLDEPFSGLDPPGIDAMSEVLAARARAGCCVLFSSHQLDLVEDLCEAVTIIDHGRLVVSGRVDDLATSGPRRLAVRVEGDPGGAWARGIPGVAVSQEDQGPVPRAGQRPVRLVLDRDVDTDVVLKAAMAAGRVTHFTVERRRLSEVFREAVA